MTDCGGSGRMDEIVFRKESSYYRVRSTVKLIVKRYLEILLKINKTILSVVNVIMFLTVSAESYVW